MLVARSGATAYELGAFSRDGRWGLLGYSRSRLHEIPKNLERRGYLRGEEEIAKSGSRRRYHLTERGIAAAREWLTSPPALPPVESELVVRVLGYDFLPTTNFLESLLRLQPAIDKRRAQLTLAEHGHASSPEAVLSRQLAFALHRLILDAYSAWLKQSRRSSGNSGGEHVDGSGGRLVRSLPGVAASSSTSSLPTGDDSHRSL